MNTKEWASMPKMYQYTQSLEKSTKSVPLEAIGFVG